MVSSEKLTHCLAYTVRNSIDNDIGFGFAWSEFFLDYSTIYSKPV